MQKVYYSIAEVANELKVNQSLLRFWEKEFPQLKPKKNSKGTRFYTVSDIETIKQIQYLLREQKLTIPGARERMKTKLDDVARRQKMVEKLQRIRKELLQIRLHLNQNETILPE